MGRTYAARANRHACAVPKQRALGVEQNLLRGTAAIAVLRTASHVALL